MTTIDWEDWEGTAIPTFNQLNVSASIPKAAAAPKPTKVTPAVAAPVKPAQKSPKKSINELKIGDRVKFRVTAVNDAKQCSGLYVILTEYDCPESATYLHNRGGKHFKPTMTYTAIIKKMSTASGIELEM